MAESHRKQVGVMHTFHRDRFFLRISLVIALSSCVFACQKPAPTAASTPPLVNTKHGPVQGFESNGVKVFKGVRYGADTATTRFAAPAAPEPWNNPQEALAYGPSCPQPDRGRLSLFASWTPDTDPGRGEDCLFLNIWTPDTDGNKRPVLVWFHGGGFSSGSGSSSAYDGLRLANRGDVVIVTVNHRLNIFGYLYLDPYGDAFKGSANAGMLDLVASLEWVRDNITQFGGDPDNVLIFGESGGGWKVSAMMAMQAASGLFHKAVVQSGPGLTLMEAQPAAQASAALIAELGLNGDNIDRILERSVDEISEAAERVYAQGLRPGARPVIDGVHNLRHPFTPNAPPQAKKIPLLIGSTQTEMSLLAGARSPELFDLTWETLPATLTTAIPGIDAEKVVAGYRALHPQIDAPNLFFEATTDHGGFGRGSFTLADRKSEQGGAPVYMYYFAWRSPVDNGKWGAMHALDIGFVFDNVAKSESMSGIGEAQQALADAMSEAWLAFAKTGNPNHSGLPDWPEYDPSVRATMVFDDISQIVNDPRGHHREILDDAM